MKKVTLTENTQTQPSFGFSPKSILSKAKRALGTAVKEAPEQADSFLTHGRHIPDDVHAKETQATLERFEEAFGENIFAN